MVPFASGGALSCVQSKSNEILEIKETESILKNNNIISNALVIYRLPISYFLSYLDLNLLSQMLVQDLNSSSGVARLSKLAGHNLTY